MKKNRILFCLSLFGLLAGGMVSCGPSNDNPNINDDDDKDDTGNENNDQDKPFDGTLAVGPALPEGEEGVAIRYNRKDKNYTDWCLWVWENNGGEGQIYNFTATDDFGGACFIPLSSFTEDVLTNGLGIITRKVDTWDGQSSDMMLDFGAFEADENGYYNVFISDSEDMLFDNPDLEYIDAIKNASFLSANRIKVETTNDMESCTIYQNDKEYLSKDSINSNIVFFDLTEFPSIDSTYKAEVKFKESGNTLTLDVSLLGLFSSDEFNDLYYYDSQLGAIYTNEKTTFKVWSPLSEKIELRIYENGTPTSVDQAKGSDEFTKYEMTKGEKGVFSYEVSGDLEGKYYTYVVANSKYKEKEIVDPYAKSTGVNGLRGMIVDFSKTNPDGWEESKTYPYKRTEIAIYETHIADVTSSETWGGNVSNSKKFAGMIESGTTYSEDNVTVKTGFDHIKELGANAVQLLPIFDQANDELATGDDAFNWGYNPLNYNSLDGIYSSNPYDGYQKIKEFKQLVKAYNDAGIVIIMDVVYNHVNGAEGSNFDVLFPEYYFRYTADGKYSNGSGCGNEVASENAMVRKFIVDSTEFWASEYHLGGFRFDLMGLHDIETMNTVADNLKTKIDENIFIHGEPWTGGTSTLTGNLQASQTNINVFEDYGAFNDKIRDSLIKGGLAAVTEKGWATNKDIVSAIDETNLKNGILGTTGTTCVDPLKATNYVTCHDNYTLYDRIVAAYTDGSDTSAVPSDLEISQMATLANAIVFTSQGTSFMLAGEELLRSKGGDGNSYASGYKVNELDYSRLVDFADLYDNYCDLVNFKTSTNALHYTTSDDIKANVAFNDTSSGIIDYTIKDQNETYRIIHLSPAVLSYSLGDISDYDIVIDTKNNNSQLTNFTLTNAESIVLKMKA